VRTFSKLAVTVVGALAALSIGFASTASAAPVAPDPIGSSVAQHDPIVAAAEQTPRVTYIAFCQAMPDTIESRTAIGTVLGAVVGGIIGLPVFIAGAIPGAIIGAIVGYFVGSTSWAIDEGHLQQQGLC
jgi:uncharacterized protein YcfJ